MPLYMMNDEEAILYEVSADKGKTWTKQWLTPMEALEHMMRRYAVRRFDWMPTMANLVKIAVEKDYAPDEVREYFSSFKDAYEDLFRRDYNS